MDFIALTNWLVARYKQDLLMQTHTKQTGDPS